MAEYVGLIGREIPIRYLRQLDRLDKMVYDATYTMAPIKGLLWGLRSRLGYAVVYDRENRMVVAYSSIVALAHTYYERLRNGDCVDTTLPLRAIERFQTGRTQELYFSSMAIHPAYRNGAVLRVLMRSTAKNFTEISQRGIRISRILADAVSREGEKLCTFLKMEKLGPSHHDTLLYERDMEREELQGSLDALQRQAFQGTVPQQNGETT